VRRSKAVSNYKDDNKAAIVVQPLSLRDKVVQSWHVLAGKAWTGKLSLVILAVLLLAIPRLITGNYWIRVLDHAGLYIMMALGLNLIAGQAGLVSLGYIAFFAVGSYTYALLASPLHGMHLPFPPVFILAGVLAGVFGFLLSIPTLPLKGDYLVMVTLAFNEIIRLLAHNLKPLTGGTRGIISIDHPHILFFKLTTPRDYYYVLLLLCAVEIFLMRRLERSRIGRAWMAIREDEGAARTMGLDTQRLKLLACAIGSIPAGLAGSLYAGMQTYISPTDFIVDESIVILSMVAVGGIGNVPGVVLGALLLAIAPEPIRTYAQTYRLLIYGAILVMFTLFRPEGIWPKRYRAHEGEKAGGPMEGVSGQVEAR